MWFSDEMKRVFSNTIAKIVDETGFDAIIIPMVEHNDNINDHIISEIKKSRFVIADFTGNRGGVYFEAGYAMGLGKQVIWTCKEEYFNNSIKTKVTGNINGIESNEIIIDQKFDIHFDINHYNFIVWKDEEDFGKRLKDRIEATIK
jgi:nucleoside 2-deoxyribosyltransferase